MPVGKPKLGILRYQTDKEKSNLHNVIKNIDKHLNIIIEIVHISPHILERNHEYDKVCTIPIMMLI
jgi:hypothetical protein